MGGGVEGGGGVRGEGGRGYIRRGGNKGWKNVGASYHSRNK